MATTISGNTLFQRGPEGDLIEEPYTPVNGCVWKEMGMCRGCPECRYDDYYQVHETITIDEIESDR